MNNRKVLIQVDTKGNRTIEEIVRDLEGNGLQVESVMNLIGVVSGTIAGDKVTDIETLDGVRSCREEGTISLPPNDPEVPQ